MYSHYRWSLTFVLCLIFSCEWNTKVLEVLWYVSRGCQWEAFLSFFTEYWVSVSLYSCVCLNLQRNFSVHIPIEQFVILSLCESLWCSDDTCTQQMLVQLFPHSLQMNWSHRVLIGKKPGISPDLQVLQTKILFHAADMLKELFVSFRLNLAVSESESKAFRLWTYVITELTLHVIFTSKTWPALLVTLST